LDESLIKTSNFHCDSPGIEPPRRDRLRDAALHRT
jgi:hypothetical protein